MPMNRNDTCAGIQDLMLPYLNNLTIREETSELVMHLAECGECRKEMNECIKLHTKIKLAFNQVPPGIRTRAYDKIDFNERKLPLTESVTDDIIAAVHSPVLELYPKLIYSLMNSPVNKILSYTFSQIN
jgi:hypothetical protein